MVIGGLGFFGGRGGSWGRSGLDRNYLTDSMCQKSKTGREKQRPHLEKGPNAFSLEKRGHFLLLMAICTGEAKREAGGHLRSAVTVISVGNGAGAPLLGVLFLALRFLLYGC